MHQLRPSRPAAARSSRFAATRSTVRAALAAGCVSALLLGCTASSNSSASGAVDGGATDWSYVPDLEVSHPPFDAMRVDWKQRLDQPYVFIEHQGSYTETGRLLPELQESMRAQGLRAAGPPFALFYDDPGTTAAVELRSRACIPVDRPVQPDAPLAYDVLPSTTVVYAVVSGAYPEVPRSYPGLFAYMRRMRWVEDGPIREIYLVRPDAVADWSELRCEVQLPVTHAND